MFLILLSKWSMHVWQRQVQRWSRCTMEVGWLLEAWQSWVHSVKLSAQKSCSWYISELSLEPKIRTQAAFLVYLFLSTSLEFVYFVLPTLFFLLLRKQKNCVFRHFGFLSFLLYPCLSVLLGFDKKSNYPAPLLSPSFSTPVNLIAVSKLLTLHGGLTELSKWYLFYYCCCGSQVLSQCIQESEGCVLPTGDSAEMLKSRLHRHWRLCF